MKTGQETDRKFVGILPGFHTQLCFCTYLLHSRSASTAFI